MTSSCAKRCAATLSSTTSSAYIQLYAIFLRSPLSGSVACNHVSTKAVQDPPPVQAFFLANAGGGPVNLVLLGVMSQRDANRRILRDMKVATGKVVGGKVVLEGVFLE